jgi:hypothetical protein
VQSPGKQFLASTALTLEQHRRVGRRGTMKLLRHLLEPSVFSDDPWRPATFSELLLEQVVFSHHPPLRDGALDHQEKMIGIDGLGQEVHRAFLHCGHRVLDAPVRGHDDNRKIRIQFLRGTKNPESVANGQLQVGEDHDGTSPAKLVDGFRFVFRLEDSVVMRFERMPQHGSQRVLVFNDENGERGQQRITEN